MVKELFISFNVQKLKTKIEIVSQIQPNLAPLFVRLIKISISLIKTSIDKENIYKRVPSTL